MATNMLGMGALARTIDKTTAKAGDAERAAIRQMVKSAKERGLDITGPDGLLKLLTKTVLEAALEEEITDHLGYEKHDPKGRALPNARNGASSKTAGYQGRIQPTHERIRCGCCGRHDTHLVLSDRSATILASPGAMIATERYACPCCGYPTLRQRPPGTFAVCSVCFWEDDDAQFRDPQYAGGANPINLAEARRNFARFGAITEEYRTRVRAPTDDEREWRAQQSG